MIVRLIPGSHDIEGHPVSQPRQRHHFRPTYPIGSYMTQPLSLHCRDLEEIRRFLCGCRYVRDKEQFGVPDHWMPPDEFEKRKQGDCDCAALWTWRQLVDLGYEARFVVGFAGRSRGAHAWVIVRVDSEWLALEPFSAWIDSELPRLYGLCYEPWMSVSWDDQPHYFEHESIRYVPATVDLVRMMAEAVVFRVRLMPIMFARYAERLFRNSRLWPPIASRIANGARRDRHYPLIR